MMRFLKGDYAMMAVVGDQLSYSIMGSIVNYRLISLKCSMMEALGL